jgi:hypothetical protein
MDSITMNEARRMNVWVTACGMALEGPLNRYVYAAIIKDARENPLTEVNRFVLGQDGP